MPQDGRLQQDLTAMKNDMSRLRSDLGELLSRFADDGRARTTALKERVVDSSRRARSATEERIRTRPFISIVMVFAVGLVLGKILDQRFGR